jgi:hypothetical protein
MCWIAVDVSGTFWVYREYPNMEIGVWAKQGKNGKWLPGEGANGRGEGLRDYVEMSYQMEGREFHHPSKEWIGGEEIFDRIIDPRLSASKYQKAEGESSILEDLDELDFVVTPAPGNNIEDGLQKLIDLMSYDTSKEIDGINRPHFYVSEDCQNIITALAEYTGNDGLKEAWKDPIDVLRYAAIADIDHVDKKNIMATRIGSGGY